MANLRLFIAIKLPAEIRHSIERLQAAAKIFPAKITWVKAENMHLTLKFLGDTEETLVPRIASQLELIVPSVKPFEVTIGGTGAFPNFARPRVFWVGTLLGGEKLVKLAAAVDQRMSELGFEPEKRNFSAHLTIGRVREITGIESVVSVLQDNRNFEAGRFTASEIHLIQSRLTPAGPIYSTLKKMELKV